jgi:hypothetical protein
VTVELSQSKELEESEETREEIMATITTPVLMTASMTVAMTLDMTSNWWQRLGETLTVAKTKANSSDIMRVGRDCLGVMGKE